MRYRAIACILVCATLGMRAYCQSKFQIEVAYPRVASRPSVPSRPSSLDKLTIRFVSRGTGFFSPNYSIEIRGDGAVVYVGGTFARIKGDRRVYISQSSVRQLVDQFYSLNYFTLLPHYGTCGNDGNEYEFFIEWPGVSKHVMDCDASYSGLNPAEKTETEHLAALKIFIEDTVNAQLWGTKNSNRTFSPAVENPFSSFNNYPTTLKLNFEAIVPVDQF